VPFGYSASPVRRRVLRRRVSRSSFVVDVWCVVIAVAIAALYQSAVCVRDALHHILFCLDVEAAGLRTATRPV
jgi:hypothetical protein